MNDSKQDCVLIVGHSRTHEMSTVLTTVGTVCQQARISHFANINAISTDVECPDLIVICQNWPDEFSEHDLTNLVKRFPISRLVCCYGVWCESDGRTRNVWPLSIRVPARCARVRIEQEWDIVQGTENAFPLTAGRDEIFQLELPGETCKLDVNGVSPLVRIYSGDCFYQAMLEEKILSWGGRITNKLQKDEADLLIYDLDPWEIVSSERIVQACHSPMVGLMGLAHTETIEDARRMGFDTIVCKVAPERELFQTLDRYLKIKGSQQGVY